MSLNNARFFATSVALSLVVLSSGMAVAGGVVGPTETDTIGVFSPATNDFFLRNENAAGPAAISVSFGPADSTPLIGDYNGNGSDSIGVFSTSLGRFFLRNTNTPGLANTAVNFGPRNNPNVLPLMGDWDGMTGDTIGLYERVGGRFLLRNSNTTGAPDLETRFGPKNNPNVVPIVGNWNGGDTIDGIGLYEPIGGVFLLKNDPTTPGAADIEIRFGPKNSTFVPIVGNWDDDDIDTIGLYDPATGTFFLRNSNSVGPAELTFRFGPPGLVPVSGNYDGN